MLNRGSVEVQKVDWYTVPLVRTSCNRCGRKGPWSGDLGALIFFQVMHECEESR